MPTAVMQVKEGLLTWYKGTLQKKPVVKIQVHGQAY
jgi:hypothetical protein